MIKLQTVTHITKSNHPRATADFLTGALCKSCRIGKTLVVEDVIETDSRGSHIEAVKRHIFQQTLINSLSQIDATQHIVVARMMIIDIGTNLCTIYTGINALPSRR